MRYFLQTASICLLISSFYIPGFTQAIKAIDLSRKEVKLQKIADRNLKEWESPHKDWNHLGTVRIDSFSIDFHQQNIEIHFSRQLSYLPVREENYEMTLESLRKCLGRKFKNYSTSILTDGHPLESLIPNKYRKSIRIDSARIKPSSQNRIPVVRKIGAEKPQLGLYNKNIALWHSHGWYYEAKLDRWEWQRARLYNTVEDLFPMTFVLPYLVPMLENAGANVFLPRERDTQIHEVIVDDDGSTGNSEFRIKGLRENMAHTPGFMTKDTIFIHENPFRLGSHISFNSNFNEDHHVDYLPEIPEDGEYSVYVSYVQSDENVSDAKYSVFHAGGKTDFLVNQQIGGGTWIYLGTFHFRQGKNPASGLVRLNLTSNSSGRIVADAVKFGGGMGNIARRPDDELLPNQRSLQSIRDNAAAQSQKVDPDHYHWKTSQRPRYLEGARYYLQYAGFPDSLVYSLNEGKNDYNDDYQSRGEWVNYLMGAPNGPNNNRNVEGLKIPVDLSLAFHTDAGVTPKDSVIGTLAIYSAVRDDGKFPNGQSKLANRDLSDMIQTEIVQDIRKQFLPNWTRRGLWNKEYSEAWRQNTPAMLLELLSHQNLTDMALGHDPRFKFAVSRAIYKGMTKFLTYQNGTDYVIQPLPVDHFSIKKIGQQTIELSWKPVLDSLEPSAKPTKYKVYQRVNDGGFDEGFIVNSTSSQITIDSLDAIYSFKITALNEGGESFPSEILAVGLLENEKTPVLVVNAFNRVAAPAMIDYGDFAGLSFWDDEGVPDKYNIGYTGKQYDFDRMSVWLDDDRPGWGASYGNMEGKQIPGNSFDNTLIHGKSIMASGYSFISTSDEAFTESGFDISLYKNFDLIFGEEKMTKSLHGKMFKVFDADIQKKIAEITNQGGNVFASGAYIGSDHILNEDSTVRNFCRDVLHFKWRTNHAVTSGNLYATDMVKRYFEGKWNFNTSYHPTIYKVEAPDAIEPAGEGADSAFRYSENNTSAGTVYSGKYKTVIIGFPFETIIDNDERNELMRQILNFFE